MMKSEQVSGNLKKTKKQQKKNQTIIKQTTKKNKHNKTIEVSLDTYRTK